MRIVPQYRPLSIIATIAFLFLNAWFFPLQAVAQDQVPDLTTYTGWMREAFAAAQRSDRLGLETVAPQLTATARVRLPDGSSITVDNTWLHDALNEAEPDLPAIAERLGAIIDALAQPNSTAPTDARARLTAILSQPPFQRTQPDTGRFRWLNDVLLWFDRVLSNLLRPIGSFAFDIGKIIGWIIGIIGFILLIGVVVYLLLGLRRNLVANARARDTDPEASLTAKTALDQASDLARGGEYRIAVRYLYLSALLWLDERDLLRYDRALTNREYLDLVRDNPTLRDRLAPIVETFDRVWYGHDTLDAASFDAYRAQVEALRKLD